MTTFELSTHGLGHGAVFLDGKELRGVRGFSASAEVGHAATLTLDVAVIEAQRITMEKPEVILANGVHDTLVALGWTPPPNPQ